MHRSRLLGFFSAIFLLVASEAAQEGLNRNLDPEFSRGNVIRVVTLDDPAQSYALYLPSHYSPDRKWPIIYAFDPFARGKTAAEVYQAAAEKYGYIVAGSNNSRNGPMAGEFAAAQTMWNDTHKRLAIDKNRVYTTGLSGGARLATAFALFCYTCSVAGVIAHGAGYPVMGNSKQPANDRFAYYVAIGDADFNLPEIVALRKKKELAGAPCKVKIYPGPHQWAPAEIAEDAIEWLELKAMQTGTEKTDPPFVDRVFAKTQAEESQAEQKGDTLTEYYALLSLVNDFRGLKDTAPFAARLTEIKTSKALKNAERQLQHEVDEQNNLTATAASEISQFGLTEADVHVTAGHQITLTMADLRRRANSSSKDHLVCARAFSQLWIEGLEAGQEALHDNRLPTAIAYFELMAQVSPDQPAPLLFLAEARVRAGDRKAALKAIEQAVQRGLKRPQTLTDDPELQPLASDPEFQRIVQGLSSQ